MNEEKEEELLTPSQALERDLILCQGRETMTETDGRIEEGIVLIVTVETDTVNMRIVSAGIDMIREEGPVSEEALPHETIDLENRIWEDHQTLGGVLQEADKTGRSYQLMTTTEDGEHFVLTRQIANPHAKDLYWIFLLKKDPSFQLTIPLVVACPHVDQAMGLMRKQRTLNTRATEEPWDLEVVGSLYGVEEGVSLGQGPLGIHYWDRDQSLVTPCWDQDLRSHMVDLKNRGKALKEKKAITWRKTMVTKGWETLGSLRVLQCDHCYPCGDDLQDECWWEDVVEGEWRGDLTLGLDEGWTGAGGETGEGG